MSSVSFKAVMVIPPTEPTPGVPLVQEKGSLFQYNFASKSFGLNNAVSVPSSCLVYVEHWCRKGTVKLEFLCSGNTNVRQYDDPVTEIIFNGNIPSIERTLELTKRFESCQTVRFILGSESQLNFEGPKEGPFSYEPEECKCIKTLGIVVCPKNSKLKLVDVRVVRDQLLLILKYAIKAFPNINEVDIKIDWDYNVGKHFDWVKDFLKKCKGLNKQFHATAKGNLIQTERKPSEKNAGGGTLPSQPPNKSQALLQDSDPKCKLISNAIEDQRTGDTVPDEDKKTDKIITTGKNVDQERCTPQLGPATEKLAKDKRHSRKRSWSQHRRETGRPHPNRQKHEHIHPWANPPCPLQYQAPPLLGFGNGNVHFQPNFGPININGGRTDIDREIVMNSRMSQPQYEYPSYFSHQQGVIQQGCQQACPQLSQPVLTNAQPTIPKKEEVHDRENPSPRIASELKVESSQVLVSADDPLSQQKTAKMTHSPKKKYSPAYSRDPNKLFDNWSDDSNADAETETEERHSSNIQETHNEEEGLDLDLEGGEHMSGSDDEGCGMPLKDFMNSFSRRKSEEDKSHESGNKRSGLESPRREDQYEGNSIVLRQDEMAKIVQSLKSDPRAQVALEKLTGLSNSNRTARF